MYKAAKKHFKKADPRLYAVAREIEIEEIVPSKDLFRDIVWTIVGQQLSARSADAIFFRLEALVPRKEITPEGVLKLSDKSMRESGLSGAKMRAIREFAKAVKSSQLDLAALESASDAEVASMLTQVKGIGPWTAEMILIFSMNRPDIFSEGDLGLRRGLMHLYNFKKPPSERKVEKILASWSPYRSYAARVLWRMSDKKTGRIGRTKKAIT